MVRHFTGAQLLISKSIIKELKSLIKLDKKLLNKIRESNLR